MLLISEYDRRTEATGLASRHTDAVFLNLPKALGKGDAVCIATGGAEMWTRVFGYA